MKQLFGNIAALLIMLSILTVFFIALKNVRRIRMQPIAEPDNNIYGVAKVDEFIEAKFLWRKNNELVFEKGKQLFSIGIDSKLTTKFVKGNIYKLKQESSGLITILK